MFENKKILITGGTGSLGKALARRLLQHDPKIIRIYSRNEFNQTRMRREFGDDARMRFFLGDIRDYFRLVRAMEDTDIVFHTAALKDVVGIEYNPFESIKTNVVGSQNVIDACREARVGLAVAVSTDKAVAPLNVYGATKLLMEKLFTSATNYVDKDKHPTRFIGIRYGNVLGSNGSVAPKFIERIREKKPITITDPGMTRFNITMDEALDFILGSASKRKDSVVFVPKLKAYNIMDLRDALFEMLGSTECTTGRIRAGEKLAEVLISSDEMRNTLEGDRDYIITKEADGGHDPEAEHPGYRRARGDSVYSSANAEKLSKAEMIKMLRPLVERPADY
ncbi:UDP-N-acetylglucosamine 4,6-dehydratase (inverting) [Nitrosopumilaceae archaeon]|nr:SDR family NAD(P)-dependent oxidoreductase [Nitrosopumilus sp.]CAI9832571.1 UDP-N-acetylglucosamine 4,6-dehydratase (inverting) [Nitrosopumilaceae archaeon]